MVRKLHKRHFILIPFIFLAVFVFVCVSTLEAQNLASRIDRYLEDCLKKGYFSGTALVAVEGEIILKKGYGLKDRELKVPSTPQTIFRIASLTKQFTAVAVMQLWERGKISLDDPVSRFFPDYPRGEEITIHHLLTHTSGIPDYLWFDGFEESQEHHFSSHEIIGRFLSVPLDFTPGDRYAYSNSGYYLLSEIIESVSGLSYEEYLKRNILEPLGMFRTGCEGQTIPHSNVARGYIKVREEIVDAPPIYMPTLRGTGDMYSTIEDLFLWDRSLYSEMVLRKETIEMMFIPYAGDYGYGFRIDEPFGRERVYHGGRIDGFLCWFSRYPEEGTTIILLNNNMDIPLRRLERDIAAIVFEEII